MEITILEVGIYQEWELLGRLLELYINEDGNREKTFDVVDLVKKIDCNLQLVQKVEE